MNGDTEYSKVLFGRYSEEEEPRAMVIYSTDGGVSWHDMCECVPDWADDIIDALWFRERALREQRDASMEELRAEVARASAAIVSTPPE